MKIALLGPPGSGKETQSRKLAAHYGLTFLTIADMIRDAAQGGTEAGRQAKPFLDLGQHVPDEILFGILRERLSREDVRQGFLLTGFPRTTHQADELDILLDELGLPLDLVLLLEVDADLIMERLEGLRVCVSCGQNYNIYSHPSLVDGICDECGGPLRHRADNNEVTLTNRLKIYEHQTASLIQYYKLHGKLRQIEAEGGVDEVNRSLCHVVEEDPPTVVETVPVQETPVSVESAVDGVAEPEQVQVVEPETVPAGEEEPPRKAPVKKSASKKSAPKKNMAKKSTAKKAAPKKGVAKKSAAQKSVTKKATTKKAAPKKSVAKKTALKKTTSKKKSAKKTVPKKSAAKKIPAKKSAANKKKIVKKTMSKKRVIKKAAPKKTTANKAVPKKSTAKKSAMKKSTTKKKTTRR